MPHHLHYQPLRLILFFAALHSPLSPLIANEQTAFLARISGDVTVFSVPGKTGAVRAPTVRFKGRSFIAVRAVEGDKLQIDDIIQVGINSSAYLIYNNGDHLSLAAGTSFTIKKGTRNKTFLDLLHGKIRAVINKYGPRKNLEIRTNALSMGIRGTDFFIAANPSGTTKVAVIRGSVSVKKTKVTGPPTTIPAGYSANVTQPYQELKTKTPGSIPRKPEKMPIVVAKTTKKELVSIQRASKPSATHRPSSQVNKTTQLLLKQLEKKAVETTLQDIKENDPDLYKTVINNPQALHNSGNLDTLSIKKIYQKAPKSPTKAKPNAADFRTADDDEKVYQKYFDLE